MKSRGCRITQTGAPAARSTYTEMITIHTRGPRVTGSAIPATTDATHTSEASRYAGTVPMRRR